MATKFKEIIAKFKDKLSEDSPIGFSVKFIFIVIFYGLIINYMLAVLFGMFFGINTIVALGIVYYLIKFELPPIIISCLQMREAK